MAVCDYDIIGIKATNPFVLLLRQLLSETFDRYVMIIS